MRNRTDTACIYTVTLFRNRDMSNVYTLLQVPDVLHEIVRVIVSGINGFFNRPIIASQSYTAKCFNTYAVAVATVDYSTIGGQIFHVPRMHKM